MADGRLAPSRVGVLGTGEVGRRTRRRRSKMSPCSSRTYEFSRT
jgi:hypothetical protein